MPYSCSKREPLLEQWVGLGLTSVSRIVRTHNIFAALVVAMVAGVPGILQDTAPYAGGAVHARPQAEAGLREFFHSMYIADDPGEITNAQLVVAGEFSRSSASAGCESDQPE